jgi:hypothetical protein
VALLSHFYCYNVHSQKQRSCSTRTSHNFASFELVGDAAFGFGIKVGLQPYGGHGFVCPVDFEIKNAGFSLGV